MTLSVRPYTPEDYKQLFALHEQGDLHGATFDENGDSAERLDAMIAQSPNAILVAEHMGQVCGTVSLIKDVRVAVLFRFAVENTMKHAIETVLFDAAANILKDEGHQHVLAYSPVGHEGLEGRYKRLGFKRGGSHSCYWRNL